MATVSSRTLAMAIQAVSAEIRRILEPAGGDVEDLDPDLQEVVLAYTQAEMEMKGAYLEVGKVELTLPPYEELVQ